MEEKVAQFEECSDNQVFDYAKQVLPLMARYGVRPIPQNYTLWYHYQAKSHPELVHEIDMLLKKEMNFTDEVGEYLYEKYFAQHDGRDEMEKATQDAQQLLSDILASIQAFGGQNDGYQQEMQDHMNRMNHGAGDSDTQSMVQAILQSVASMKDSSGEVSQKLAESQREIDQLKENLAKAQTESEHDFLTGVYNRKALDKRTDEMIAAATEERKNLCLIMLDIDHFKRFNDEFGHLIGDEVLKIVAKSLTNLVKGQDVVARYGGEEFAILLPDTPLKGGVVVANTIREAIAKNRLKRRDTGESFGQITISAGVSLFRHEEDTVPTFMQRADAALYQSKENGRNQVTMEESDT